MQVILPTKTASDEKKMASGFDPESRACEECHEFFKGGVGNRCPMCDEKESRLLAAGWRHTDGSNARDRKPRYFAPRGLLRQFPDIVILKHAWQNFCEIYPDQADIGIKLWRDQ